MANGIKIESAISKKQILFATEPYMAVGIVVNDKRSLVAGTPMTGDLKDRLRAFTKATTEERGGTKGVTNVQVGVAGAVGDYVIIEGVTYTCGDSADAEKHVFDGKTPEEQVASLAKMVDCEYWDVEISKDSADTLVFTQKIAETGRNLHGETSQGATLTFDVNVVTEGVSGEASSNAVGVLLHDVKEGETNATLLIFGYVDLNKVNTREAGIDVAVEKALDGKVTFLR